MVVKRIDSCSLARITGCLFAVVGLLGGCVLLIFVLGGLFEAPSGGQSSPLIFVLPLLLPVAYGAVGYVLGIAIALLYNSFASIIGGVVVEIRGGDPAERE